MMGQRGDEVDVEMMPFKQEFIWHLLRFLYVRCSKFDRNPFELAFENFENNKMRFLGSTCILMPSRFSQIGKMQENQEMA
jgi:hypothetical protein